MSLNDFLIEAHKALDAATVEDGIGNEALCMLHLGKLHGLILVLLKVVNPPNPQRWRKYGCTWVKACPNGCFWITPVLCSACRDNYGT